MRRSRLKLTPNLALIASNRKKKEETNEVENKTTVSSSEESKENLLDSNILEKESFEIVAPSSPARKLKQKFRPNLKESHRSRSICSSESNRRIRNLSESSDGSHRRPRTISTTSSSLEPQESQEETFKELTVSSKYPEILEDVPPTMFNARKAVHKKKFHRGIPERSSITMFDFIFHNPVDGTRMTRRPSIVNVSHQESSLSDSQLNNDNDKYTQDDDDDNNNEKDEENDIEKDEEAESTPPVPQVKIGPEGQIIVDEESTYIETTAAKKAKEEILKAPLLYEHQGSKYGTWSKRRKTKDWTEKETLRFYKALSIFGTDFSMMSSIFKKRSRQDLKTKFKKEERGNRSLVDRCLSQEHQFDVSIMEDEKEEDEDDKGLESNSEFPRSSSKVKTPYLKGKKRKRNKKGTHKNRGYYDSSNEEPEPEFSRPGLTGPQSSLQLISSTSNFSSEASSFPPGLLEANPELASASCGSLVVVASPMISNSSLLSFPRSLSESMST